VDCEISMGVVSTVGGGMTNDVATPHKRRTVPVVLRMAGRILDCL